MRPHRVLILYNELTLPPGHPDADSEHEITFTVDEVTKALEPAGYQVARLAVGRDPADLFRGLRRARPDVVFNLFEGLPDWGDTEAYAVGLLEWLGLPYTGCPLQPIQIARNKPLAKKLFRGAKLPTPEFVSLDAAPVAELPLDWPVILKPANQDASVGIDQGSVVTRLDAFNDRLAYLLDTYGPPVLAEEFVTGREFAVGLVEAPELRCLPIAEMQFLDADPDRWPIITYDGKWRPGSPDYDTTPPACPAENVTPKLAAKLTGLARKAYRLVGCRDYARVDFRVRPSGKPFILEVNPNPDFSPTAGLAVGLGAAGLEWGAFAVQLVQRALARGRREAATAPLKVLSAD
jgi:D-alanine-D-alanine ligase